MSRKIYKVYKIFYYNWLTNFIEDFNIKIPGQINSKKID